MGDARGRKLQRFTVMGAGEVGLYLSKTLSADGHEVTLVDLDESKRQIVEDRLDVKFVSGNGAQVPILEAAGVASCDLFVAASSSDEANLAASLLAKRIGAPRSVVRVSASEDITEHGRLYEAVFAADLMLSTQLLTTTRILNQILGYNTLDIEYLARGELQVRKTLIEENSPLLTHRLADVDLPPDCLVLAFLSRDGITVPTGEDRAHPGDEALLFGRTAQIDDVERRISGHPASLGVVVIAGGSDTAREVAKRLSPQAKRLKIIESDRSRAERLAAEFPRYEIIHGDATDPATLASEGIGAALHFIALTGHDETNLMACLLARELGARQIVARVQRSDTSTLWRKAGLLDVVSPRMVAAEQIRDYIESGYQRRIMSLQNGTAQFVMRRVQSASAAAGGTLADITVPRGLIVAAVLRDGDAIIPNGSFQLRAGDDVVVFAHRSELATVQLLFPGADEGEPRL
jgi:trk system potassium uptake protein TrkA